LQRTADAPLPSSPMETQSLQLPPMVLGASPRLMLIGDSITEGRGASDSIGFRKILYQLLQTAGLSVDFVGSSGESPYEGHFKGGSKIWEFSAGGSMDVASDMEKYHPTATAIHLGTNGFTANIEPMITLVNYLLTWRYGKGQYLQHIVVSQIIPRKGEDSLVVVFNMQLAKMVQDFQKGHLTGRLEPVYLCDHFTRFLENPLWASTDGTVLMADDLHPNSRGHDVMANAYMDVLAPLISGTPRWFTDATWRFGVAGLDHYYGGQGMALADLNNDGTDELYLSRIAASSKQNRHLLYASGDTLPYPESAAAWQAKDAGNSRGVVFFDMDSDGDLDLFNAHSPGQNVLLENVNHQSFRNVTSSRGIESSSEETTSVLAFDVEGDGDLDLFVLNKRAPNELYLNDGKGTFTRRDRGCNDVRESSTVERQSAAACDFDLDGDVDLYVVKRFAANRLYVNDGAGVFTDRAAALGVNLNHKGNGVFWSDLDNDGDSDLLITVSDISGDADPLLRVYKNTGGVFSDVSSSVAIPMNGYSILLADFDNDGRQDILTSGEAKAGALYRNDGGLRFTRIDGAGAEVFAGDVRAASAWDADGDGDMDAFFHRADAFSVLKQNTLANANHFLRVTAKGRSGLSGGFGGKLWCYRRGELGNSTALLGYREIVSASGHLTQPSPTQHFGLGSETRVDLLALFADGTLRSLCDLAADQSITIEPELDPVSSGAPAQLLAEAGGDQSAVVGRTLNDPLTVKLVDANLRPVANVRVDFTLLSGDGQLIEPAAPADALWLEPELGGLSGAMRWCYDDQCSGGGLIMRSPLGGSAGFDTLRFQVSQAADYYLWLRLKNPDSSPVALSVKMDGTVAETMTVPQTAGWQWQRVALANVDRLYTLSSGAHVLLIRWDAGALQIDRALFTRDTYYTPVALGEQNSADLLATDKNGLAWRQLQLGQRAGPLVIQAKALHYPAVPAAQFTVTAVADKPTSLVKLSGDNQVASKKGETLADPLTVAVHDAFGNGVSARPVRFSVLSGGGTMTPADGQTLTDANGRASVLLSVGGSSSLQRVNAATDSVINSPVTFQATVTGVATELRLSNWTMPTDTVNRVLSKPLQLFVLNDSSKPVVAYPVRFHAWGGGHVSAGQSASSDTAITLYTNAEGLVQAWWQLSTRAGEQKITAEAPGLINSPATATALALAARPASLLPVSGDHQQAQVATALKAPFQVRVLDGYNNSVAAQTVLFKVTTGDGHFNGSPQVTAVSNANGLAAAQFTVGTKAGINVYTVEAAAAFSAAPAVFWASATAGPAAGFTAVSATQLSGVLGALLPSPIQVAVTDSYKNPVSGFQVQFSVVKGDGVFSNATQLLTAATDEQGIAAAHYRVGIQAGNEGQQVKAFAAGLNPSSYLFRISAVADRPASLTPASSQVQVGAIHTQLAEPFMVRVTDVHDNPVQGHAVQFTVLTPTGTLQGQRSQTVLSDSFGLAKVYLVLAAERGDSVYAVEATSYFDQAPLLNSPVRFYASTPMTVAARLFPITNPNQWLTGHAHQEMDEPVTVQVIDESGLGVGRVAVIFTVTAGTGVFLPDSVRTLQVVSDANGLAQVHWVLGEAGMNNKISAAAFNGTAPLGNSPIIYSAAAQTVSMRMELVSAPVPTGTVFAALAEMVQVKITDMNGAAVSNHPVRFKVVKGGGLLTATLDSVQNAVTNSQGIASAGWRLGTEAGEATQQLLITALDDAGAPVAGSPLRVTALALADVPDQGQSALTASTPAYTGSANGSAITLVVRDRYGNPVVLCPVALTGSGLVATITPADGLTDSSGVFHAQAFSSSTGSWTVAARNRNDGKTLGQPAGVQFVRLTARELVSIGALYKTGVVADTLADRIHVQVLDEMSKGLANSPVEFIVKEGDAEFLIDGVEVVNYQVLDNLDKVLEILTDQNGEARIRLLLGTHSGVIPVTVRVKNTALRLDYQVELLTGAPARVDKISGDQQTGVAGHRLNQPLQVRLFDQYGNGMAGHALQFSTSGGGNFTPSSHMITDSLGNAQVLWQLGRDSGLQQTTVSAVDLKQAALFVAQATPNSSPTLQLQDRYVIQEGRLFVLTIPVQDAEMDSIILTMANPPAGSTLQGVTFSWTPDFSQAGLYPVQFIATDHLGAGQKKEVILEVLSSNRPPVVQMEQTLPRERDLGAIQTGGAVIDFIVQATDPDGDQLFYSWLVNGVIRASGNKYRFQADGFGNGDYAIRAVLSDGVDTTSVLWRLRLITAVQLSAFTGGFQPHTGIRLQWKTRTERDNLGFYVLRATGAEGPFAVVSPLIRSNTEGRYEWTDTSDLEAMRYFYRLQDQAVDGRCSDHEVVQVAIPRPTRFDMAQNYPNPFNSSTVIAFQLPSAEPVTLQIFDVSGRLVATLLDGVMAPGYHKAAWNARNRLDQEVAGGVYHCVLSTRTLRVAKKMILLR